MSAVTRSAPFPRSAAVGAGLLAAAAAWWVVAALAAGRSSLDVPGLLVAAGAVLAACWAGAARRPAVVAAAVVGAAAGILLADPTTFRTGPTQGPFGYANATAAFLAQACVAALLLVVVGRGVLRAAGVVAATGFAVATLTTESWSVALVLPAAVLLVLGVHAVRGHRAAVAGAAGLFLVALVGAVALGAWGPDGPVGSLAEDTITRERVGLWHDALAVTADHPVVGVGPGGFARASAIAAGDEDLRWAHNEFLQAGAEAGLPGYTLAVGLFVWGFAALAGSPSGRVASLAAAGLAVLGTQANVDYVLHFPFVVLVAAAVVGIGLGARAPARPEMGALVPAGPVGGPA